MSHAWRSWPNFLDAEPEPTLCVGTTQPVLAGEKSSRLLLGLLDRMSRPSPCSEPPTLQQSGQWPDPPFLLGRVFRCPEPSGGLTEAPRVAVHWRSGKGPERALKRHSYHLSALVPDQEPVQLTPQMRALLSHQLPFWSDFFLVPPFGHISDSVPLFTFILGFDTDFEPLYWCSLCLPSAAVCSR